MIYQLLALLDLTQIYYNVKLQPRKGDKTRFARSPSLARRAHSYHGDTRTCVAALSLLVY